MQKKLQPIYTILKKEVSLYFNSLIAYIVIAVYLISIWLFYWVFSGNILETGEGQMDTFFALSPFLFLFIVPALTMRTFSEEFKSGAIEFLATKPITDWQIVLGKYFACCILLITTIAPTLFFYFLLYYLAQPVGGLDNGAIWGAYLGLIGIGFVFAAIGIFCSTLTENQVVAFLIGCFFSGVLYTAFDFLADLKLFGTYNDVVLQFGIQEHYRSISRGVVDTRDIIYYLSLIVIFLLLSHTILLNRKS